METNNKIILKDRMHWVDIARGIAIILVIVGHAIPEYSLNCIYIEKIIYSMHMSLFFILSGIVFKVEKNTSIKENILKKAKKLLIPYFLFALLILLCHIIELLVLKEKTDFFIKLFSIEGAINTVLITTKSVFSNLWFLPCIFVTQILLFIILKYEKVNYIQQ